MLDPVITEKPMLGRISFDPDARRRLFVVHADPCSPRAEPFRTLRTLRTNLQFLDIERACSAPEPKKTPHSTVIGVASGSSLASAVMSVLLIRMHPWLAAMPMLEASSVPWNPLCPGPPPKLVRTLENPDKPNANGP